MSSTNRSKKRLDHKYDYYRTPISAIDPVLDLMSDYIDFKNSSILDPCAGGDKDNVTMPYHLAIKNKFNIDIDTMDIRQDSSANIRADFLSYNFDVYYDLIISNPPFNCIQEFINKSFSVLNNSGYLALLLRLNFFESKKRYEFFQDNMPIYTYVLSKRVSFTKDNKTDSIPYCYMVWKKNENPEYTRLKIIQN